MTSGIKAPAILVYLHESIQRLPAEARKEDPHLKNLEKAVKAIVESDNLHPAFGDLHKLAPHPIHLGPDILYKNISPDILDIGPDIRHGCGKPK